MSEHIIIIGSGFGGLATASRLLSEGYSVEIFEKRDKAGGRAYVYEKNGFTFDGGPTVITAPFLFDEIFDKAGRKRENYISFTPCDPFYRIFNADGDKFDYNGNHEFVLSEIERWNPNDKQGYTDFIKSTKAIFQKGFVELADQPFLSLWDMIKVIPDLIRLQSHRSVYNYISKFIENDFLRRVFSFHPLLVGGNPFDTTSIYAMIHYLEREWGVHYAMGGTGAIIEAFTQLIEEQGGKIHLEAEVDKILIQNGKASGVRLKNGARYRADKIVSNADVAFTYRHMIPKEERPTYSNRKLDRMRYSMSLFVIYFGTKKRYLDSKLEHHNIILGERYEELLQDIFHNKELAEDFSLYLHMPTKTDPSLAPEGCESFYVLSPVPHLDGDIDWNTQAPLYRDAIMNFLEENYLPDLQENIVVEHHIDPLHFQNTLNSYKGSAFSIEPILTQSAWFRPHNKAEDIDNLFFVGAGTHPGAGIPGVLSSAKIAEKLICS
ncbi:phytoene desaturase [Aliifodinibius salicampi]|uniref:Phytoene dehydrogenase n=1 Tax=Fodinibius salicampi TaxID=1920655 RepID=A0ABT3Q2B6_9BACT|nr:phytoene desaturase [Fodinibius salicampi]MCW9714252.1 phytoene desaturase [Fodinibius salicampi]